MPDYNSPVSGVAGRYATALFELARDSSALDQVKSDLDRFAALMAESADLVRLVRSPVFSTEEQLTALSAVLDRAGIGGMAANFIRVVTRNRRLFAVPDMIEGFNALLARHRGETSAVVTSAEPLSGRQVAALKEALQASLGANVALSETVDPSLLGGLIVKVGSRMIDTSLKTKLSSLKIAMKEVG